MLPVQHAFLRTYGTTTMECEEQEMWFRHHVQRLRTILRFATDPSIETPLKEVINDAEAYLEMLAAKRSEASKLEQS
jgi:hypothetical protein